MEIKAVIGVQIFSLFAITAIQLICLVIIFIKLCQIGKKLSPPPAPPVIPPRSAVPPNSPAPAATVKSIPVPPQPNRPFLCAP